jgi:hypothetical protein
MLSQRPVSTQADSVFMLCGNENISIAYTLCYFLSQRQCHWPPGQVILFPDSSLWGPSFSSKPGSCLFWRRRFHYKFRVVLKFSIISFFHTPLSLLLTNIRNNRCYVIEVHIRHMEEWRSQCYTFLNLSLYGGKLYLWGNRTLERQPWWFPEPVWTFRSLKKPPTSAVIEPRPLLFPFLSLGAVPTVLFLFMALHRPILTLNNIKGSLILWHRSFTFKF